MYISRIWREETPARIEPKFFLAVGVRDVITWLKFGDDRLRGFRSAEGQSLPFPIDFDGRPYNSLTLPCERVIVATTQALTLYSPVTAIRKNSFHDTSSLSLGFWLYHVAILTSTRVHLYYEIYLTMFIKQ